MKKINIIGSQIVNDELRFQHENPIEVSDAEAKRLHDGGMLLDAPAETASKAPTRSKAAKRKKAAPATPTPAETPAPAAENGAAAPAPQGNAVTD